MKFGYVIDIGYKFFHNKFQGSNSKNKRFSGKKRFYNDYFDLTLITLLVKVKNAPKFEVIFLIYLLKDPESFIKLS